MHQVEFPLIMKYRLLAGVKKMGINLEGKIVYFKIKILDCKKFLGIILGRAWHVQNLKRY